MIKFNGRNQDRNRNLTTTEAAEEDEAMEEAAEGNLKNHLG